MCVTVCNIGRDQNQQFICNERKAAELASLQCFKHYNKQAILQSDNHIHYAEYQGQHRQSCLTDSRQWSEPMQCFVIEYFCFWFLSSQATCWLGQTTVSGYLQSWHVGIVRTVTLVRKHETGGTRKWVYHDNTPPLWPPPYWSVSINGGLWLVSRDRGLAPAWTLFTLRWFVTDPDIDWRNFNSIIDTRTWTWAPGHCMSSPSQLLNKTLTHSR